MTKTYCDCCAEEITAVNNPDQEGVVPVKIDGERKLPAHISANIEYVGSDRMKKAPDNIHVCLWCRLTALNGLDKRPTAQAPQAPCILLTSAEISSNLDRVKWAESLIEQLPAKHNGVDSWLMDYGTGIRAKDARSLWERRNPGSILVYHAKTQSFQMRNA